MNNVFIIQSVLLIAGLLSVSIGLSCVKSALKRYSRILTIRAGRS